VLGDAIHCPLQLSHPEWEFSADVAPDTAVRSREHLLRELEAPDTVVVGPHFPDAVFGRVVTAAAPTQVLFDVAPPAPPQAVRPDAAPGTIWADPLDD
jgi:hypothetical protein